MTLAATDRRDGMPVRFCLPLAAALLCSACSTPTVGRLEPPSPDARKGWVLGSLLVEPGADATETMLLEPGPPARADYTLFARRGACTAPGPPEYAWKLRTGRERLFGLNLSAGEYRFCHLVDHGRKERLGVPLAFSVRPDARSYLGRIVLSMSDEPGRRRRVVPQVLDDRDRARDEALGGASSRTEVRAALARRLDGPPETRVCSELARAFFLIAQQRDRGASREDQVRMVRKSVSSPFVTEPDVTLLHLLEVVDFVYLYYPDSNAYEVESVVLQNCRVNERGQAVFHRPHPIR